MNEPVSLSKVPAATVQSTSSRRGLWNEIKKSRWAYLFVSPFYILFLIFGLYPILFSIVLSFTEWNGRGPLDLVGFSNYQLLLRDKVFWQSMINGVILFCLYVPLMTFLALVLAVVLNSRRVRGFQFFRTLIFLPFITNMVAAGFAFQLLFNEKYGVFNAILSFAGFPTVPWLESVWGARVSLSILIIWAWLGYNMVIMLAGLQTIPHELSEAALIDGANQSQAFFYVTIPLLRPVILFSVVLSTLGSFGLFAELLSLFPSTAGSGPLNSTITPLLAIFNQAFGNFRFGYASSMAYVYFVFIFLLTLFQVRRYGREEG